MTKKKLYDICVQIVQDKIAIAKQGMEEAQASANNETKSSAGDKYETGRAMSQRERDLHARQLAELINMKKTFSTIDPKKRCAKVELGAYVETATAKFFVSASLGAVKVGKETIMAISAISPIAQAMLGKQAGDTFIWMKKETEILSIG
ncbi:3-oxoacyl-ACP synthase [Reichenbachiella carrageenanivorans]|uniref:3-oxoacyl-ACP synthase n=1 Tax=Reichenbachiella carrageenanivorans TaxID=2979869 RepID=A0ABY6D2Z0_9BACT|nr:3-oxoacyl-ACP synthase [Reichenbachiella carrageenanivorans]UXX80532.1 3-oxoacyl-ACP synthase [Reichenbachiella carrageenanivorans]